MSKSRGDILKKIIIMLSVISFALVGCSQEQKSQISEPTTERSVETNSKTKINDLELKKSEEIEVFEKALSDSKKEPGIVNMTNPQYQFSLGEDLYFLWIKEEYGTIMNTKDTNTIYTLSSSSVKEVYEFVNINQSQKVEEVVYGHMDIQNLEGLDKFINNIENQNEAKLNFIQYGTEGQRGVRTLTFDGEQVNVFHSVDGNFIEEYSCKKLIVATDEEIKKYILSECTGSFNGDFELLSVPN